MGAAEPPAPARSRQSGVSPTDDTRTVEDPQREGYTMLISAASGVQSVHLTRRTDFVIGRASGCDIVVVDDSISREHARLRVGERLTVEDLGSKNGVRVAGERIAPRTPVALALGSVFELGSVTLVLQGPTSLPASKLRASSVDSSFDRHGAVVKDPTMRRLYALLDILAPSPLAVLILGETGVGKEVFARAIHEKSPRARAPFIPVHCAALPEAMLESELFGHERGAFTGAAQAKPGLFEAAEGGTVFLDEVGEIPMGVQAKLLRVLEAGEVRRLGSLKARQLDVRFVTATNRDLRSLICENRFRDDLFFRLNGISLTLPPLRERKADVGALARAFATHAAAKAQRASPSLTPNALALLEAYAWPGNVRELRNVMERALLLGQGSSLDARDLERAAPELRERMRIPTSAPSERLSPPGTEDSAELRRRLHDLEKKRIEDALAATGGNQSRAAKTLGITRYALMYRMGVLGLVRPRKRR